MWDSASITELKESGIVLEMKGENNELKYILSKEGVAMGKRVMEVLYKVHLRAWPPFRFYCWLSCPFCAIVDKLQLPCF
jgi:hypothetical protein